MSTARLARLWIGIAAALLLAVYTFSTRGSASPDRFIVPTDAPAVVAFRSGESPIQQVSAGETSQIPAATPAPSLAMTTPPHATTAEGAQPSAPPTPAVTPVHTATPAPILTPIVLAGAGNQVLPFAHPGGAIRATSEATTPSDAGCTYIGTLRAVAPTVLAYDPSLTTTVIWIEAGGSQTGWVELDLVPGTYEMAIEADCAWSVTIAPR